MTDSPQCSDIDDSASGCEFYDHGAAGDQCFGGDALFIAIRGSAARPVCRPRPQRAMRAMEQLLKDAALALSQDVDALCPGSLPAAKHSKQHTRPALLVGRSREIAASFLLERDSPVHRTAGIGHLSGPCGNTQTCAAPLLSESCS